MLAVRYFTRSGNTRLLAEAIASSLQGKAQPVSMPLTEKADVLFLGSSVYAGRFDPAVGEFLRQNADKIGQIVLFGSSASGRTNLAKITELAASLHIPVSDQQFSCPGHFLFLHKDRPNADDLKAAADFARHIVGQEQA